MPLFNLSFLVLFILFFSESKSQLPGLGETFLRSLKEQKFELLKDHFPTIEFYKSLPEASKNSDTEIKGFLKQSNDRLKENWQKISLRLKTEKTDVSKIELIESLVYDPFEGKNEMRGMVIVYKHGNKTWDDLTFIIAQWKSKTFLLEIPNPTRAFMFEDETLRASNEARNSGEMKRPGFKSSLEEQVKKIIKQVNENDLDAFAGELVYRGEDERRKWKTAINVNEQVEKDAAADFMKRVKGTITDCNNYQSTELTSEKESEGIWIILHLKCEKKTASFAFLRIGDRLLLGDIDSEAKE